MTTKTIILDTPIKRGETEITQVELRKPAAGELRGLSLTAVTQMEVDALIKLLPRITTPTLTPQEVAGLDLADLTSMGGGLATFFLSRAALAELAQEPASPSPTP